MEIESEFYEDDGQYQVYPLDEEGEPVVDAYLAAELLLSRKQAQQVLDDHVCDVPVKEFFSRRRRVALITGMELPAGIRSRGLGSRMVRRALSDLKAEEVKTVWLFADNSFGFWTKFGFQVYEYGLMPLMRLDLDEVAPPRENPASNPDGCEALYWGNKDGEEYLYESGYDILYTEDRGRFSILSEGNEARLVVRADEVAKALGLKLPCVGFTEEPLHDGDSVAVFLHGTESSCPTMVVSIDQHQEREFYLLEESVLHELAHAYQWTVLPQDDWDLDDAEEAAEEFCHAVHREGLKAAVRQLKSDCKRAARRAASAG